MILIVMALVVVVGAFFGYAVTFLPIGAAVGLGAITSFIGMCAGIMIHSFSVRRKERELGTAMAVLRQMTITTLKKHSEVFNKMVLLGASAISNRVAIRTVEEMMPHLSNEEQRDAALKHISEIISEEMNGFCEEAKVKKPEASKCQ